MDNDRVFSFCPDSGLAGFINVSEASSLVKDRGTASPTALDSGYLGPPWIAKRQCPRTILWPQDE